MVFFCVFYCFDWVHLALFCSKSSPLYRFFCHPATEFFALKSVFLGVWRISIWQQRRYVGWLVGWLVGQFGLFGSDSFGQIVACRSPIIAPVFDKMLSSGRSLSGFTSVETLSKHAFFGDFWKFLFSLFSPLFSSIVATFATTLHVKQF